MNNLKFEWDDEKEQKNISKHKIDFSTAALVFNDDYRIEMYDERHSIEEDRYITIGQLNNFTFILMVVYTERKDAVRIISARLATKKEKEMYRYGREDY